MGSILAHTTFLLSFQFTDQGHPLEYRVRLLLHPHAGLMSNIFQRGWGTSSLLGPIRYTAYRLPYSWHVGSTFKCLTTTITHCGLNIYITRQMGCHNHHHHHQQQQHQHHHHLLSCPSILIVATFSSRSSNFYFSHEWQEITWLLPVLISKATSRTKIW